MHPQAPLHVQVQSDRLAAAAHERQWRQVIASARARRRLERAERQAAQARVTLIRLADAPRLARRQA
jgi:hypothetical protein